MTPARKAMDDDLVKCKECGEEVLPDDVCDQHGVCLWCDTDCKLAAGEVSDES